MQQIKKSLCAALCAVMLVGLTVPAFAADDFSDVPPNHWAYADVMRARGSGIVSGVGNNRFNVKGNVAYSEMIKMVINTVFRDNYDAYVDYNGDLMRDHFGDKLYWFSFMCYYAKNHVDLLNGIDVNIDDYASCTRPMSRYDMAMLLYNTVDTEGIEPTEAQKTAARNSILDYDSIPAKYRDAVTTCYALKTTNAAGKTTSLLTGSGGYFKGDNNMTRAEACAQPARRAQLRHQGHQGQSVRDGHQRAVCRRHHH